MRRSSLFSRLVVFLVALLPLGGCAMVRLHQDLGDAEASALISGVVEGTSQDDVPVLIVLHRNAENGLAVEAADRLADRSRSYAFQVEPQETYCILAFRDLDDDGFLDDDEPFGVSEEFTPLSGRHRQAKEIRLRRSGDPPAGFGVDFTELELRSDGISIVAGEVTDLDDPRFTVTSGRRAMWTPLKAFRETGGGVYFLEEYDPHRTPVLFVYGIGGSPQDLRPLIETLDRTRYQPWIFHYPSGVRLDRAALFLDHVMNTLHRDPGFERLIVVAHSMGGLVARSFALRTETPADLLITFATPWSGHQAAQLGVKYAPVVVPAWIDLQPDSEFLQGLRTESSVEHHLFFAFHTRLKPLMLYSHDTVVSVATQLDPWIQERAHRLYGIDQDHAGILSDPETHRLFRELLSR